MRLGPLLFLLATAACTRSAVGGAIGGDGPGEASCPDSDRDGYRSTRCGGDDCDDAEATIRPHASEVCGDGIDQDCDGTADGGCDCVPGDMRTCWSGEEGTRGVGTCLDGAERCEASGRWGPCEGEVLPVDDSTCDGVDGDCDVRTQEACPCPGTVEICGNGIDDDCDGVRDDPDFCFFSCVLADDDAPASLACCADSSRRRHTFICAEADGLVPCAERECLQLQPGAECRKLCTAGICTCGQVQDGVAGPGPGCGFETPCNRLGCDLRRAQPCYTGLPQTLGVGACRGGVADCIAISGSPTWGSCVGEILPAAEVCGNDVDDDCDGRIDEDDGRSGKPCPHGRTCIDEFCGNGLDEDCDGFADEGCPSLRAEQPCWTGDPTRRDVGECASGRQRSQDGRWLPCEDEVLPAPETCGDGLDTDCDGRKDAQEPGCCRPMGEEVCNGIDDDCDGLVDEELLGWCGGCGDCRELLVIEDPGACGVEGRTCERIEDDGGARLDLAAPPFCDRGLMIWTGEWTRFDPDLGEVEWSIPGDGPVTMACDGSFWMSRAVALEHRGRDGKRICSLDAVFQRPVAVSEAGDAYVVSGGLLHGWNERCEPIDLAPGDPARTTLDVPDGVVEMGFGGVLWIARNPAVRFDLASRLMESAGTAPVQPYLPRVDDFGNLWFGYPLTRVPARGDAAPEQWTLQSTHVRFGAGSVWVEASGARLARFDPVRGVARVITEPAGHDGYDPVIDLDDVVWATLLPSTAGSNVLGRYEPELDRWTTFSVQPIPSGFSDTSHRSTRTVQMMSRGRARWQQDLDSHFLSTRWEHVTWNLEVPDGSTIDLEARFADSRAGLDRARPCALPRSPAELSSCAGAGRSRWMRLSALLQARQQAPVLQRIEIVRVTR